MAGVVPYKTAKFDPFGVDFWTNMFLESLWGNTRSFHVDIKNHNDRYEIEADLPGLQREMITVSVEGGYLTISTKQEEEKQTEKGDYLVNERRTGGMARSFSLHDIKEDAISAEYKDGVLKVILPKSKEDKQLQRSIDIK